MPHTQLLTLLADAQPHHITELARVSQRLPQQLNALWQQQPDHIRGLLRQQDGLWRLVRPLALVPESHRCADFHLRIYPETTSSNDELMNMAKQGRSIHKRVALAYQQSKGRGRQGRVWEHRLGECLMFSVGWTFAQSQQELGALSLLVALACQRVLVRHHCPVKIKWSNDLMLGLDKLGGILVESVRLNGQTHVIMGIGINFVLPKNVENAASLHTAQCKSTAAQILDDILHELNLMLPEFETAGFAPFRAEYEAVHRDHNQEVVLLQNGAVLHEGKVVGIAPNGALQLQNESGNRVTVFSGEVSLRRPEQIAQQNAQHIQAAQMAQKAYLLLDGGNSRLKWAWVQNGKIVHTNHAPYRDLGILADEWAKYGQNVSRIVGSAVCGLAKQALVANRLPEKRIEWLSSMKRALGVYNHYQNPAQHGADRWFNALGSRLFSQNACVVVSCGTAVTVDAMTADGHYLGGTIMPGFHLMKESLAIKTANLNQPLGKLFPFPTTTANAIAGGMMDAVCGSVMLMHSRLQARCSGSPTDVIITGGGAAKVANALPETFLLDNTVKIVDNLVIYGLLAYIEQAPSSILNTERQ
ncbi:biotin--[acetyl-CoA-carboxylase] ligase [Alysiella filiformis]|uniref:Type III pantothenate kinase n=1 Tax=Alysiella filiformis DSM 16848 TaxID=1120981 RepID=A0A286E3Z2_9NEIS|nr:biotin--[acetyl-CoA-carboxylase] ligase [Alysiella filiformis]QMT31045.1 biotin--[acetyl-CoA-carboxylase] ligase [Alysiella filiformis]UBQ55964.1 biotin--[acetyl-CoA-carboxylase] ligase [Alysiella filiformis DSM 16848]SOD65594.1 biotin-[acetyl-CoA-carboxylase] ligase / type 3 pantothenate kinase [Alysiella filiformis DSM 16848]